MRYVSFALLFVTALAGCARKESAPPAIRLPVARVRLAPAHLENVPQITEVTGTVRPVKRAVLAAQVTGAITELPVALGQRVRADEVLVRIVSTEVNARVTQA